ncbi:chaoptin-like isoform X2 [Sitophilus oryzae]|nr:chaoptin-like isoform X2 [Sitophilus oryzae]
MCLFSIEVVVLCDVLESNSCIFNPMCSCSEDQNYLKTRSMHSITCLSTQYYKFPNVPKGHISQLEVVGSEISTLESDSLVGCQLQAFVFSNNYLQHISEKAFSSSWKNLTSLDLSYNYLDNTPFPALKEVKQLQWLNLHKNQISSVSGDWSEMRFSLTTLFLGENDIPELTDSATPSSHEDLRQLTTLIWLNLDGNRIHKIHKHALPTTLQTVSLSYNLIDHFPLDIISTMPQLQWLYLRGNYIKTIPQHTFSKRLWIQKIDLSENYLKFLPTIPFNNSIYIKDLNLALNDFITIAPNSFSGLECRRIILSYNQIEKIEDDAFQGISEILEYLDLNHNRLTTIPSAITQLTSIKYLYLSFNYLNEFPEETLESFKDSLKALSLSGNHLSKIPSSALRNCSKITYLNIGFNQIHKIYEDDFIDWGNSIQTLILNNNRISHLSNEMLIYLTDLKELSLSFNPLRNIERNTFLNLTKLVSLELSHIFDRDDLPFDFFQNLENLQILSLDHNNFHEIKPESFDFLPQLTYLNLEYNKISVIPFDLFKSDVHSKLTNLRLSNNEISHIESRTFESLDGMIEIIMSENKIRYLQAESFRNMSDLSRVILSNNLISHISSGAFSNLPSLRVLDLQYNQLTKISFKSFLHTTMPLYLNLSFNTLSSCVSDKSSLRLEVLDLRYNSFTVIPQCLQHAEFLKKLYLNSNSILSLEYRDFMSLFLLNTLDLNRNQISVLDKNAFFGLKDLQVLDLSKNMISHIHSTQFIENRKLRVLNLSRNSLNYLPRGAFNNTLLEFVDLSYNAFSNVPSSTLVDTGLTLRHLSLQSNNLEHIDITTFPDISFLYHLNLSKNKLTILPDNVFTSLNLLQHLDLSSNPLRANFKELFHYAQNLKYLNLANTGITLTPNFPLPNLVHLNLSMNGIESINKNSMSKLSRLKYLDLSNCRLNYVPSHLWPYLTSLKYLDLSYNHIKELTVDSFYGLKSLQVLNIQHLKRLTRFEGKALTQLRILSEIRMQTWPNIEHFYEEMCYLFSHANQLRILSINIIEHIVEDQFSCLTNRKITRLEITGRNIQIVDKHAFAKITKNPSLTIKISGTQIAELPSGLFVHMKKIQYLSIDLSNNMLSSLGPETFYGNSTTWDDIGTTLISGGLRLSGNRFRCGCHLAWLGHWLRRWTRESLQAHSVPLESSLKVHRAAKEATCWDSTSERHVPIVKLPSMYMSCPASALSSGCSNNGRESKSVILVLVGLAMTYFSTNLRIVCY